MSANDNPRSAGSTERSERRLVAIDADDGKAQRAQIAHVPAVAAGDVENTPARPDQGGPATHPGRGRTISCALEDMAQIISRRGRWRPRRALCNTRRAFLPEERPWHPTPRRSGFPAHPAPCFPRDWTRPPNLRSLRLVRPLLHLLERIQGGDPYQRVPRERGVAVLRFDFTGLGGSEGEFANTNFSSNVGDLVAAAGHLRKHYRAPAILIGHSLGGTAVLAATPDIPECAAVATVGSPFDPGTARPDRELDASHRARRRSAGRNRRTPVPDQKAVPGRHPGQRLGENRSPGWERRLW